MFSISQNYEEIIHLITALVTSNLYINFSSHLETRNFINSEVYKQLTLLTFDLCIVHMKEMLFEFKLACNKRLLN